MAEELSPESKLFVKEEIEKVRKEVKEDLKEAQSKATKTFSTVVVQKLLEHSSLILLIRYIRMLILFCAMRWIKYLLVTGFNLYTKLH